MADLARIRLVLPDGFIREIVFNPERHTRSVYFYGSMTAKRLIGRDRHVRSSEMAMEMARLVNGGWEQFIGGEWRSAELRADLERGE